MADNNDKITLELDVDNGKLISKLNDSQQSVVSFAAKGAGSFSSFGASAIAFNQILDLTQKAFEILKTVVVDTIGKSIEAAMENEKAFNGLNLAIENAGYYSKSTADSFTSMAEGIANTSNFSKDLILNLEAQAVNLTKNEQSAKKLTQAAVELAAATGKDVNSSMQVLAMSLEGLTSRGLNKLVPGMRQLTVAELEAGKAADMIIDRFGGSAEKMTQTFSGRVTNLEKSFHELHETIGNVIIQSPVINKMIDLISDGVKRATEMVKAWAEGDGFKKLLNSLIDFAKGVNTYIIQPLEGAYNFSKLFIDSVILGFLSLNAPLQQLRDMIYQSIIPPLTEVLVGIAKLIGKFAPEIAKSIEEVVKFSSEKILEGSAAAAQKSNELVSSMVTTVNNDMGKLFDFSVSDKLNPKLEQIRSFFNEAKVSVASFDTSIKKVPETGVSVVNAFSKVAGGFTHEAAEMAKNTNKSFESMGKTMIQGVGTAAGGAFASFGKALATGKNSLEAFGKAFVQSIGQMAVQLGTKFILEGTAYLFVPGMEGFGGPLIAAGAALATFGGVLSGLAGGGDTAGGGGVNASGNLGGPASASAASTTPLSNPADAQKKQAQIIINGDFLNSRETANHLADILRQNSDITDYAIVAQGKNYA